MKRGQNAATAAILLAIIAGILIFFIIVAPPQTRLEILGENTTTTGTSTSKSTTSNEVPEKTLLEESPGRIDYYSNREVEHPLPVVTIETSTQAKTLAEVPLAYIKRGIFSEKDLKLSFTVSNLDQVGTVLFTYSANTVTDNVIISLNGKEIFNGKAKTPITLPKNLLKIQNELIFRIDTPGISFWRTNEASLSNIKIVADVTNLQTQSAKHVFLISETEKINMERVLLKFQPSCQYGQVGKLTISINGEEIYNGVPDCDLASIPIELSPNLLSSGENIITFSTEHGMYLLSHIILKSQLKQIEYPTYYFDISLEQFNEIQDNKKRVRLNLEFVDVTSQKFGEVYINGARRHFDTKEKFTTLDLDNFIVKGTNSLKIKPSKTLEVRELKIDFLKS